MSTCGFGFSKIHTSLLYLTGNYMEMWHNGEQASGATIAVGATTLRATVQQVKVSSNPHPHPHPDHPTPTTPLSHSQTHSLIHLPLTSHNKNVMFKQEF